MVQAPMHKKHIALKLFYSDDIFYDRETNNNISGAELMIK